MDESFNSACGVIISTLRSDSPEHSDLIKLLRHCTRKFIESNEYCDSLLNTHLFSSLVELCSCVASPFNKEEISSVIDLPPLVQCSVQFLVNYAAKGSKYSRVIWSNVARNNHIGIVHMIEACKRVNKNRALEATIACAYNCCYQLYSSGSNEHLVEINQFLQSEC